MFKRSMLGGLIRNLTEPLTKPLLDEGRAQEARALFEPVRQSMEAMMEVMKRFVKQWSGSSDIDTYDVNATLSEMLKTVDMSTPKLWTDLLREKEQDLQATRWDWDE